MIALFLVVANQIAIQCLGIECSQVDYTVISKMIGAGTLELIFEAYGFIRIYARRDKVKQEKDKREKK